MKYKLIATSANPDLTQSVVQRLDSELEYKCLIDYRVSRFKDSEACVEINEDLSNHEIFVLANLKADEHLMELYLILDVLSRMPVSSIHVCIPYFLYSRSDRLFSKTVSVPVAASMISRFLSSFPIDKVSIIDIHSLAIMNSFQNICVYNHLVTDLFINSLDHFLTDSIVVAPDIGAMHRARSCADKLNHTNIAVVHKERLKPGDSKAIDLLGDVSGKHCIIFDDIIDTAGTLCNAAALLKEQGAKSVVACITHGLFSGSACDRVMSSALNMVYVANTVEATEQIISCDKIKRVSVSDFICDFICK